MQLTPEGKKSVSEALNEKTFKETLFNSMKHFSVSVNLLAVIFCAVLLLFSFLSYHTQFTLEMLSKIIDRSNTVILAMFAVIVTAYAIFQAMLSTDAVVLLMNAKSDNTSLLSSMQYNFFFISISYIIIIILNYLLLTAYNILPVWDINITVATLFLSIYCTIICYLLFELTSLIYNLYQGLKLSLMVKVLSQQHDA